MLLLVDLASVTNGRTFFPDVSYCRPSHNNRASLALRSLGYILHHEDIVTAFSDECASAVLNSVLKLVTSTDQKALCSLGVWCLGTQEFQATFLENQIHLIVQALVHAIDNPMGSKAVSYEALQAVVKMVHKTMKMRAASPLWTPPVYRRLFSTDKRDRDMAERCLKSVEPFLLPPLSSLSEVVAVDINQALLQIMGKMVKSRALVVPAIRAWSWLIRLLGSHQAGEKRALVNQMLKIAEITFTNPDSQVQIATLVAWEALIDSLLQFPRDGGLEYESDMVSPSSGDICISQASPSLKRLKLLMVPLITIMSDIHIPSVRLACWRTWTYLVHKVGLGMNAPQVQAVVVTPMFEVIFNAGPELGTPHGVWDLCLSALEAMVASKFQNELDFSSSRATSFGLDERVASPKTPTPCKSSENEASHTLPIRWASWSVVESLESILSYVRLLWTRGVKGLQGSSSNNPSFNGAIRILYLVIQGVGADGNGSVKPSSQNVESVHTVLRFIGELVKSEVVTGLDHIMWQTFGVLLEFGPLVLSSSFYKISSFGSPNQAREDHVSTPSTPGSKEARVCMSTCSAPLVTPVAYMIALWIQLGSTVLGRTGEEESALERLEKLASVAVSGLGVMNSLQGVGACMDHLISHETSSRAKEAGMKKGSMEAIVHETCYFLRVWRILAGHMANYIESSNDVEVVERKAGDSGYQVVYRFLLIPLHLCSYATMARSQGGHDELLDLVMATWTRLFDCTARVSALKSSQPNFFSSTYCQKLLNLLEADWQDEHGSMGEGRLLPWMLGGVVKQVLQQAEVASLATFAINRKRRLGSFNVGSCLNGGLTGGNNVEDVGNIRDILSLASRMLSLSWNEVVAGKTWWSESITRVFGALTGLVSRLYLQQDALIFLQDFSMPMAVFLSSSNSGGDMWPGLDFLLEAFRGLWEKLLNFLQRCQPPLTYNSKLLSLQAPLLVPSFQHSDMSISNSTLLFWEATYGIKTSSLKYPPCLVPVLGQLKAKVDISLPGWDKMSDKGELDAQLQRSLETPKGERMDLRQFWGKSLKREKGANYCAPTMELGREAGTPTIALFGNAKLKTSDRHVEALLEKIKRPVDSNVISTGSAGAGSEVAVSTDETGGYRTRPLMKDNVSGLESDSGISVRRKKLRFLGDDDEELEYVSIPFTQKKAGPLTNHQKEVRLAQSGIAGSECVGRGAGVKTYTRADFSQSQIVLDSEEPDEMVMEIPTRVVMEEEKPLESSLHVCPVELQEDAMPQSNNGERCHSERDEHVHMRVELPLEAMEACEAYDTQLVADTQLCDTQLCDTQPHENQSSDALTSMTLYKNDKTCTRATNLATLCPNSDDDLASSGSTWTICDLLRVARASSQWESMDFENVKCAQELITLLQIKAHKMRKSFSNKPAE